MSRQDNPKMADLEAPYRPQSDTGLRDSWLASFDHRPNADAVFERLLDAYREPNRYYHSIEHAREVATAAKSLAQGLEQPEVDALLLAAWSHDAYYDPSASDNEARSAAMATELAQELAFETPQADLVAELVLVSTHRVDPKNRLERTLCDADLSGLAKSWAGYRNDVLNIRCELAIKPDADWRAIRLMILDFFEGRSPLFYLPESEGRWDARARHNFAKERATLALTE